MPKTVSDVRLRMDWKNLWNDVASYCDAAWEVADYSSILASTVSDGKISSGMKVLDVLPVRVLGIGVAWFWSGNRKA